MRKDGDLTSPEVLPAPRASERYYQLASDNARAIMILYVVPLVSRYRKLPLACEVFPDAFSRDRNRGPEKDGVLPSYIHIRPDAPPKYVSVLPLLPRVHPASDPLLSLTLLPPLPLPFA
jgi:hypothetical protein